MSAPTASTRLLSTFELLEDIILYLPLRQILLSQRVGRAFANVITGSKPIQRALFLAPHDDETIKYYPKPGTFEHEWKVAKDGEPLTPVVNPFLPRYTAFRLLNIQITYADILQSTHMDSQAQGQGILHP